MILSYLTPKTFKERYYFYFNVSAIWWNCLGITTLHVLYIFTAWIAWAFYNSVIGCDPIQTQVFLFLYSFLEIITSIYIFDNRILLYQLRYIFSW